MDLARLVAQESLEALKGFVIGEAADLAEWGNIIAADAVRAVKEGRQDILSELGEQAKGIAELKRIKASGFAWDQIASVVLSLAKVAVQAMALKG
jgi:hypothetical protein